MKFNGKLLKQIRLAKGLKQQDLSDLTRKLGKFIDPRTLSNWESSTRDPNPRPHNLAVVAKALDISLDELYIYENETENMANLFSEEEQLIISHGISLPFIKLLELQGYICSIKKDTILLRASGRKKDILLSIDEFKALYEQTGDYVNFLLYKISSKSKS